jgi:hypothetical protein
MQANHATKRGDRNDPANKAKHDDETSERPNLSQSAISAAKMETGARKAVTLAKAAEPDVS